MNGLTRRGFLGVGALGAAGLSLAREVEDPPAAEPAASASPLKIGIVTYNIAKDWDLPTILENCQAAKYDGVELRTGHAHGVELTLTPSQRTEVKRRLANSPVKLAQLGSTYEFHSTDPAEVTASDHGVEVRVEVHGSGTSRLEYIQKIMEIADHPLVTVNWNSNQTDLEGGTLEENFARVSAKIRHAHMRDLFQEEYPWRKLIALLSGIKFQGYCCAEIPETSDPLRVMRYFRALLLAYQGVL